MHKSEIEFEGVVILLVRSHLYNLYYWSIFYVVLYDLEY